MKNKAKICLGIVACSTVMMSSFFNKKSQTSKAAMLVEKNVKGEVFKTELKNKYLYTAGMYEWLLLQNFYGEKKFPTTGQCKLETMKDYKHLPKKYYK